MRCTLPTNPRDDSSPRSGSAAVRVSSGAARTPPPSLVQTLRWPAAGESGLAGPLPESDGEGRDRLYAGRLQQLLAGLESTYHKALTRRYYERHLRWGAYPEVARAINDLLFKREG